MQLEQLSLADEADILALLQDVWPRLYGATGCPQFSSDYLRWLYGGPEADRHLLLGYRLDGRLVGFKSSLLRDLRMEGKDRIGGLATHLTIRPELPPDVRLSLARELSILHRLYPRAGEEAHDLALAYFESNKVLVRNITRLARQQKLNLVTRTFSQAILNARRAIAAAAEIRGITVREFDPGSDMPAIQRLRSADKDDGLKWVPTEPTFLHHLTMAPDALVLVAEDADGQICGLLGGYCMDWLKDNRVTRMLIVESLMSQSRDALACLLAEAARRAAARGYRGTVIENPTMIDDADAAHLGVMASQREMVLSLRSHEALPDRIGAFTVDVK